MMQVVVFWTLGIIFEFFKFSDITKSTTTSITSVFKGSFVITKKN